MLIVFTSEKDIENEAQKINQLFEAGLLCLHLRKPNWTIEQHKELLNEIEEKYHNQIVVHHCHELINQFNLKGIHFTERQRRLHLDNPGRYFKNLSMYGKTISTSFHSISELQEHYFEFDYYFLSPVFTSISKKGYEGKGFDVNNIDKNIIALGGIHVHNIKKSYDLGYKGVAVLGSIWNNNSLESYIELKKANSQMPTANS